MKDLIVEIPSSLEVVRDDSKEDLPVYISKDVSVQSYELPNGEIIKGDNLTISTKETITISQIKEQLNFLYVRREELEKEIKEKEEKLSVISQAVDDHIEQVIKNGAIDSRSKEIDSIPLEDNVIIKN